MATNKYLESLRSINPKFYTTAGLGLIATGAGIVVGTVNSTPVTTPDQNVAISKKVSPIQSQRDNFTQPHRTCNTSSNAMFLNFYRPLMLRDTNYVPDDEFLVSVLKRGDTTVHQVQTDALKAYGLASVWNTNANLQRVVKNATLGVPTVVNILHRGRVEGHGIGALRGGHVIVLVSYDPKTKMFAVNDPYGNLAKGYPNSTNPKAGEYEMSLSEFKTRWQGGYRVLTSAQSDEWKLDRQ